jgi:hypothetical protein
MKKEILDSTAFTFDASAKTITFTEDLTLSQILLVTNVTDNIIIYNFGCEGFGGSLSAKVLTLEYNTITMSDTDDLQIIVYRESADATRESKTKCSLNYRHVIST